jgi:hypothetical protein
MCKSNNNLQLCYFFRAILFFKILLSCERPGFVHCPQDIQKEIVHVRRLAVTGCGQFVIVEGVCQKVHLHIFCKKSELEKVRTFPCPLKFVSLGHTI